MSKRFELIFGYLNSLGNPKKVAKIVGKKQSNNEIADLIVIQYDMKLFHFTLHNTEIEGMPTRYHLQAQYRDMIAEEDMKKFPEVLHTPLPDFEKLSSLYSLQSIPIFPQADDERNIYDTMNKSEYNRYSDNLADLSGKRYDRHTAGLLSFYLVPESAKSALREFKASFGNRLFLWNLHNETLPGILAVMTFQNFFDERRC